MPRTSRPLFLMAALCLLAAPPVSAQPNPGMSSVGPWDSYGQAFVAPGTQSGGDLVTITVLDAGGTPVVGSAVEVDLSDCSLLCVDSPDGLTGTTNGSGQVSLDPRVGGCEDCDVLVKADGVTLRTFLKIVSPDWDGSQADGLVNAADSAYFTPHALAADSEPCADYDGDGTVGLSDLIRFSGSLNIDANANLCLTPDPGMSSVGPWDTYGQAFVTPGTQSTEDLVTVTVLDAGGIPVVGSAVEVDLSDCSLLCIDSPDGLAGTTNGSGQVTLNPRVGGCEDCDVLVKADGVTIASYLKIVSTDWDGSMADGLVNAADSAYFTPHALAADSEPCADYDGDGTVGLSDATRFSGSFNIDANTVLCGITPDPGMSSVGPWDTYGQAFVTPGTQSTEDLVTVTVLDAGGIPVVGSAVEVDLSDCSLLCIDSPDGLAGTTNGSGQVTLNPRVGGCEDCDVLVKADGVTIASYLKIVSTDWDGSMADGLVNAADSAYFTPHALAADSEPCADYDGDGTVGLSDATRFSGSFNIDANTVLCFTAPDANPDNASVRQGLSVSIPVLVNDSDPNGDPLTVSSVDFSGSQGSVVIDPGDTTVTYTANLVFNGVDTFLYRVTDGSEVDSALVTVTVTAPSVGLSSICLSTCPAGDLSSSVQIIGTDGLPFSSATVILDFSSVLDQLYFCSPDTLVTTNIGLDGFGEADFFLPLGGALASGVRVDVDWGIGPVELFSSVPLAGVDWNANGVVDCLDVMAITPFIIGAGNNPRADYNCDGVINQSDASELTLHNSHACDLLVAVDDIGHTWADSTLGMNLVKNDQDPSFLLKNGCPRQFPNITVRSLDLATFSTVGSVAISPDSVGIIYVPQASWVGRDSLLYVVGDTAGMRDTARVTVVVTDAPDAGNSTTCLVACPLGDYSSRIELRDANNLPILERLVLVDFSAVVDTSVLGFCGAGPDSIVELMENDAQIKLTDIWGNADLRVFTGSAISSGVVVSAEGPSGFVILDPSAGVAGFDLDGNDVVDAGDTAILNFLLGSSDARADYNCDGIVNSEDGDLLTLHLGHGCDVVAVPDGDGLAGFGPQLGPIYPNPMTNRATVLAKLPKAAWVKLTIHDISGRLVRTLADGMQPEGEFLTVWDGRTATGHRVSSGVYFIRMQAGPVSRVARVVLRQ